ncbi:anti-sigma regulatory factor (Ser/Thr protein kinase) [Synechococcus sp. PCC 7502]|uniref:ATP-binding protein n=1 Tax=Synechococcus sp. PCC 7502 TaxID=1173263 RepID=UPI00029FEB1D|nr:anti-sigma regulatory factor [Synechococcus sp. PCC 7502]AFY72466.1 anti-sigma regulatory factor (Ser/Thr protein kinase) [Synechococcus sp. PCC 7502]
MVQTIALQVNTDLSELAAVLNWFEELDHTNMPKNDWLYCKTALAEVFTNAVRHAHKGMPKNTPILLEAVLEDHSLEMKVFDYGAGFALSDKLANLDDVDINALGGRGLDLIHQIVDVFRYDHLPDGRNCLLMIKRF